MKQFVRSVPAVLFLSGAALMSFGLVGCSSVSNSGSAGGGGSNAPAAAKNIYEINTGTNSNIATESVMAFSVSATGSVTPASTLMLPSNFVASTLAIGPQGQIYVGGRQNPSTATFGTVLEYPAGSSGSVTPSVTLNGSAAGTATFTFGFGIAVNSANTLVVGSQDGAIAIFASGFTASSAPTQYLTWGKAGFEDGIDSIAIDTAGEIFVQDDGNGRGAKSLIDVFAAGATGAAAPARQITGTNTTTLYYDGDTSSSIVVDGAGDVYLAYYNATNDPATPSGTTPLANNEPTGIIEFAAGATGNATPLKRISGALTKVVEPMGLAVDLAGNLYYLDANESFLSNAIVPSLFEVFSSSATGNVAATTSFSSTSIAYNNDDGGTVVY
jgi:hypothetical protein